MAARRRPDAVFLQSGYALLSQRLFHTVVSDRHDALLRTLVARKVTQGDPIAAFYYDFSDTCLLGTISEKPRLSVTNIARRLTLLRLLPQRRNSGCATP